MATSAPKLTVTLQGESYITGLEKIITWTAGTKLEQDYLIKSTDGNKTVDLTNLENLELLLFTGSGDFVVTIVSGGNTIAFVVNGVMLFTPTSAFAAAITSITISTSSVTDVSISVRVYGATA